MKHDSSFAKAMMNWFKRTARDLPWRRTDDPYRIWISEIMLQQTTVKAVLPYYVRWIAEFPTIEKVAEAPLQKILRAWQGLGYYQRVKNIHATAKVVTEKHGGKIPQDYATLRDLPGFGAYTTASVLSIAFDHRLPVIDGNVRRVVMRLLEIKDQATGKYDPQITAFLDAVMPQRGNNIFNQALMELGALVCRKHQPLCLYCPVKEHCRAYKNGTQEIIPTPKKSVLKNVSAVIAVIERERKFFIQQRPAKGLLGDLWEFPGGKIEADEMEEDALVREVREELNVEVVSSQFFANIDHFYTQFRVNLSVWKCSVNPHPVQDKTHKWVTLAQMAKYPMPSGSARIVDKLREMNP